MKICSEQIYFFCDNQKIITQIVLLPKRNEFLINSQTNQLHSINQNKIAQGKYEFKEVLNQQLENKINNFTVDIEEELLVVCKSDQQPFLYDIYGWKQVEFLKGDMYLKDQRLSKGHIREVTYSIFDNQLRNIIFTCSSDCSLRKWDLEQKLFGVQQQLASSNCYIFKDDCQQKISIKKIKQHWFNNNIYIAGDNGEIGFLDERTNRINYCFSINDSFIDFDFCQRENLIFLQTENQVNVFDIRDLTKKISNYQYYKTYEDARLFNNIEADSVLFSCLNKSNQVQLINYNYQTNDFSIIEEYKQDLISNIGAIYQDKKQTLMGTNKGLFINNQNITQKNQTNSIKKNKFQEIVSNPPIFNPNILPMFRTQNEQSRYWIEKIWENDKISLKPEVFLEGPGYGGYISGPWTVAQNIMQQLHKITPRNQVQIEQKISKQNSNKEKCQKCGFKFCDCKRKL